MQGKENTSEWNKKKPSSHLRRRFGCFVLCWFQFAPFYAGARQYTHKLSGLHTFPISRVNSEKTILRQASHLSEQQSGVWFQKK
jgi:hypothetical protein